MINYIIQVVLFQVLFLAIYDLFLSKETFFTKNRWYLLGTAMVSFVLPFLKIPTLQKAVPIEYSVLLPEVVLSPQSVIEQSNWYQSIGYLDVVFYIGISVFLLIFILKLEKIIRLILANGITKKGEYKLVLIPKQTIAFSFFNFIFLGKEIDLKQQEKIIEHELVHSKQKHSIDLLFFEFLRIIMWFNPMIYVYQKRITLVHEYISDAVVLKSTPKKQYINNMLSDVFQVENISFINQFYKHSLIKKRVIMMTKEKSKQIKQVKYLLLIPVLASMLFYTSCSESVENEPISISKEERIKELTAELKSLRNDSRSLENVIARMIKENEERIITEAVEDIPFSIIEISPTFPGCTDGDKDCFNKMMQQFVQQNFNAKLAKTLDLKAGKKRIYMQFKISEEGKIENINARAPHPKLKEEAINLAKKLPIMKPGLHKGKPVKVGYTLPIIFNIE